MKDKEGTLDKKSENLKLKNKAKMQKLQEKGITLIALVVTIVILLILAGVTLNIALSDNGLFNKAKKAVEDYKAASESEAISIYMISSQLEGKENRIGKTLLDRTLDSNSWNVVVDKRNNKTYGTGWNYIEKGTEIEGYGKIENGWLINYETGEIVQLEEGKYDSITIDDTISVKEDFIINIDSAMVDKGISNNKASIETALGKGVELHNFEFDNDGLVNNEFVLDGENDFITVNLEEIKNSIEGETSSNWLENGFTIELYGAIEDGKHYRFDNEEFGQEVTEGNYSDGIFEITSVNDGKLNTMTRVLGLAKGSSATTGKGGNLCLLFPGNSRLDLSDEFDYRNTSWWKSCLTINYNQIGYFTISIIKDESR